MNTLATSNVTKSRHKKKPLPEIYHYWLPRRDTDVKLFSLVKNIKGRAKYDCECINTNTLHCSQSDIVDL